MPIISMGSKLTVWIQVFRISRRFFSSSIFLGFYTCRILQSPLHCRNSLVISIIIFFQTTFQKNSCSHGVEVQPSYGLGDPWYYDVLVDTDHLLVELTPCNIGSDVALIDVSVNCVRRIAGRKKQKSTNQLRTADWKWNGV